MLIESKIKIGYDSMFNVPQAYFKSAHLLNKMALVQSQRNSTVPIKADHACFSPMKPILEFALENLEYLINFPNI